jgi:site-specific recombinase XerD
MANRTPRRVVKIGEEAHRLVTEYAEKTRPKATLRAVIEAAIEAYCR